MNSALADLSTAFDALYSPFGRESIPPERLLRALLLQAFYSIRSERQLVERIEFDLLFRWFVGLGVDDPVWDATTFTLCISRTASDYASIMNNLRFDIATPRRAINPKKLFHMLRCDIGRPHIRS